jgi:peptide deformylase
MGHGLARLACSLLRVTGRQVDQQGLFQLLPDKKPFAAQGVRDIISDRQRKTSPSNQIQVSFRSALMPGRDILQLGNPLLWQPSAIVTDIQSSDTQAIIRDLSDTLAGFRERTGFGRGIAAPQIGALERVIFIRMQPTGFAGALVNPAITWSSSERMELWDDCFSFPDLMVRVSRAQRVRVAYKDERGAHQTLEAEGDLSELLQHEIDHLDGILAVDRALSPHALMTRAEWLRQLHR